MNDTQLSRYSRHLLLPEIDTRGQEVLLRARVLIVGLGGLGSPAAMYLAASGVGTLVLCDSDHVELSNLQRQILHTTPDIGEAKTTSARARLQALNPDIRLVGVTSRLEGAELERHIRQADLVIDCSDNFTTRYALNAGCVATRIPLVLGAAIRMRGQVSVFRADKSPSPCYRCLYPESEGDEHDSCARSGVFAPLTGIVGSIQAAEAIKVLLDIGETLEGGLLHIDARTMQFRRARLRADPDCPVCATASPQATLEARAGSG